MGRNYLGELEQSVLAAVLRLRSKAYGVTIKGEIEKRAERTISYGAVYTTLDRLADKGYVTSRMGEPTAERGGRRKRFYEITAAGQAALQAALNARSRMFGRLPSPRPVGA